MTVCFDTKKFSRRIQEAASRALFVPYAQQKYGANNVGDCPDIGFYREWVQEAYDNYFAGWQAASQHDAELMKAKDDLLKQSLAALQKAEIVVFNRHQDTADSVSATITAIQQHLSSTVSGSVR